MGGEEECQKRTNNGLALSPTFNLPSDRTRILFLSPSLSLSLFAFSFYLFLLPFIVFVCQLLQRTTVQTERRRKKVEGGKEERKRGRRTSAYVRARAYWTSFML